ncbi:MAG TPA: DUF4136 domain-containing protein [Steroidobacteraceae bacterium]
MRTLFRLRPLSLAVLVALLAACASKPTIRSNVDPAVNFSQYRSFGFLDEATGHKATYDSFANQYIKSAVVREMQARGLQQAEAPDLLVNVHVQTKDKVRVSETPGTYAGGYYGYRGGMYGWGAGVSSTTVDQYTEGTLNVDVIDRATSKLVWEGIAVGRISSKARDNPQPAIDVVVKQVFERYPAQPTSVPSAPSTESGA